MPRAACAPPGAARFRRAGVGAVGGGGRGAARSHRCSMVRLRKPGLIVTRHAWIDRLNADPRPWLLDEASPAVRAAALIRLEGRSELDSDVVAARRRAMRVDPIKSILEAQDPAGWWVKPGPGYAPKYAGTVWNLIFLEQLGADPANAQVRAASEYVLRMTATTGGGLGCSGSHLERPPPPSSVLHCLNGNLLRALIRFGDDDDPRVKAAVGWEARAITGSGMARWYRSGTSGPGFACGVNDGRPCAWGAVKALRGLAAIPPRRRTALVRDAIAAGVEFLFSRDPGTADYPMPEGDVRPSALWFKLGFPSGYSADVLQVLEVLAELGHGRDPRLEPALSWLLSRQDAQGRWRNRNAYNRKTTVDVERQGEPSKWVTLRACTVLAAAG